MSPLTVVYDACVLYPAPLRSFLMSSTSLVFPSCPHPAAQRLLPNAFSPPPLHLSTSPLAWNSFKFAL